MAPFEPARSACSRQTSRVARRLVAALIAAFFMALALGIVQRASGPTRANAAGVVSVPAVSSRSALAARANVANPLVASAQPSGHRRIALGDVCLSVAAVAAAYLFFTRTSLGARRRRHFEAVFASGRGPPALLVAH